MECVEQCVVVAGITMMPELCVDNWGTVVEVSSFIVKRVDDVVRSQMLPVCMAIDCKFYLVIHGWCSGRIGPMHDCSKWSGWLGLGSSWSGFGPTTFSQTKLTHAHFEYT